MRLPVSGDLAQCAEDSPRSERKEQGRCICRPGVRHRPAVFRYFGAGVALIWRETDFRRAFYLGLGLPSLMQVGLTGAPDGQCRHRFQPPGPRSGRYASARGRRQRRRERYAFPCGPFAFPGGRFWEPGRTARRPGRTAGEPRRTARLPRRTVRKPLRRGACRSEKLVVENSNRRHPNSAGIVPSRQPGGVSRLPLPAC
jgi:hypothetical protein